MHASGVNKLSFTPDWVYEKCTNFFRGVKNNPKEVLTTVAIALFVVGSLVFAGNPLVGGLLMLSGAALGIATGLVSKYVSKEQNDSVKTTPKNTDRIPKFAGDNGFNREKTNENDGKSLSFRDLDYIESILFEFDLDWDDALSACHNILKKKSQSEESIRESLHNLKTDFDESIKKVSNLNKLERIKDSYKKIVFMLENELSNLDDALSFIESEHGSEV